MTKPRIIACESVGCPGPRAAAFISALRVVRAVEAMAPERLR